MRRIFNFLIRVFIVSLSFIIDIRVHADVVIEAVSGKVEMERNAPGINVQSYAGSARLIYENKKIGVDRESIFSIDKTGQGQLARGSLFLFIPPKSSPFIIEAPQAEVKLDQGHFYIEVTPVRTQVSVLSGRAALIDRAEKKETVIKEGYASWLGGLLATGRHSGPLRPEACELTKILEKARLLMSLNEVDFQNLYKRAEPSWKDAVVKVADDSQAAVDKDIQLLNQALVREQIQEEKINHEQALLRKLFREKTIGVPFENKVLPLGSDRDPASDLE